MDLLLGAQNEDGGWGAVKGKRVNTKSRTPFALMAMKYGRRGKLFNQETTAGLK